MSLASVGAPLPGNPRTGAGAAELAPAARRSSHLNVIESTRRGRWAARRPPTTTSASQITVEPRNGLRGRVVVDPEVLGDRPEPPTAPTHVDL